MEWLTSPIRFWVDQLQIYDISPLEGLFISSASGTTVLATVFCHNLVALHLLDIPPSGYISPAVMITCLITLIRPERLTLGFQSPGFFPDREA